jgi:hypothetical protein
VAWNLVLYQGRDAALAEFKVRLHGADTSHPEPGFIVGRDQSASWSHNNKDGRERPVTWVQISRREIGEDAFHVATFRFGAVHNRKLATGRYLPTGIETGMRWGDQRTAPSPRLVYGF